jgi:hypothetical protein
VLEQPAMAATASMTPARARCFLIVNMSTLLLYAVNPLALCQSELKNWCQRKYVKQAAGQAPPSPETADIRRISLITPRRGVGRPTGMS